MAISLLIGGGKVTVYTFYVLLAVQTLLIYAAVFFAIRADRVDGRVDRPDWRTWPPNFCPCRPSLPGGRLLHLRVEAHESNVGSLSWWLLLGLAGWEHSSA